LPIEIKYALSGIYAEAWRNAIRSELASLHNKGTIGMENLPVGRNAISNNWVFKAMAK
jgi:hypothetical protein